MCSRTASDRQRLEHGLLDHRKVIEGKAGARGGGGKVIKDDGARLGAGARQLKVQGVLLSWIGMQRARPVGGQGAPCEVVNRQPVESGGALPPRPKMTADSGTGSYVGQYARTQLRERLFCPLTTSDTHVKGLATVNLITSNATKRT